MAKKENLMTLEDWKKRADVYQMERYQARLSLKRLKIENEALKKRIRELSPPTYISKGVK